MEIRKRIDEIYKEQKSLSEEMESLRKDCPHKETREANYSWRIGHIQLANLCVECDELINYVGADITTTKLTDFGD